MKAEGEHVGLFEKLYILFMLFSLLAIGQINGIDEITQRYEVVRFSGRNQAVEMSHSPTDDMKPPRG